MPVHKQRLGRFMLGAISILALILAKATVTTSAAALGQKATSIHTTSIPLVLSPPSAPKNAGLQQVNSYRARAGVPPISEDRALSNNCVEHARYMAENNELTHHQDPNRPYASPAGQICAENGNAWLGSDYASQYWDPVDSVEGWISSVGHRLWLLYPTSRTFGFGFYTAQSNRAGAAMDVLSRADFGRDEAYTNWPVRYPGNNEPNIPHTRFPITLNWRYFGPKPELRQVSLTTAEGTAIPHEANTNLPSGHKGIQIIPSQDLPQNSTIVVSVSGTYDGAPFSYTWQFTTGATYNPYP